LVTTTKTKSETQVKKAKNVWKTPLNDVSLHKELNNRYGNE
jgi:hypothetical protein